MASTFSISKDKLSPTTLPQLLSEAHRRRPLRWVEPLALLALLCINVYFGADERQIWILFVYGILLSLSVGRFTRNLFRETVPIHFLTQQHNALQLELPILLEINRGFSEAWWTNYRSLVEKRNEGRIAPDELRELVALTDTIEEVNVQRMSCFASTSKMLGLPLDELMTKAALSPKLL